MSEERSKPRTALLTWMIVSQLLTLAMLVFWLAAAGLSFMAFDSGESRAARMFVIAVWAYPVFPVAMVIAAWVAFARRKNVFAAILSGISSVPPILFYIGL